MPRSLSLNNIHMNTHLLFGSTRFFFLSSISNLACKKTAKCINQGQIDVILTFIDSYKCLLGTWYYDASPCTHVFQYVRNASMQLSLFGAFMFIVWWSDGKGKTAMIWYWRLKVCGTCLCFLKCWHMACSHIHYLIGKETIDNTI